MNRDSERSGPVTLASAASRIPRIYYLIFAFCLALLQLFSLSNLQDHGKVNFFQVYHQDLVWVVLVLIVFPVIWYGSIFRASQKILLPFEHYGRQIDHRLMEFGLIFLTLFALILGTKFVYHEFTMSLDETLLRFQAAAFSQGYAIAPVEAQWQPFIKSMQPLFVSALNDGEYWFPLYRPVSAAIVSFFGLFGLSAYTNAFLAVGSALLLARITRNLWPDKSYAPALSIFFLVTSGQFLFTAMSMFAMTSHLFFNLLWLCLFMGGRRRDHLAAALVGFLAIGLHQVIVHPFFVLPFMIDLLWRRRFGIVALYTVTYAFAAAVWINWTSVAVLVQGISLTQHAALSGLAAEQSAGILRAVERMLQDRYFIADLYFWASNFVRLVTWQNLATVFLALAAVACWRDAPRLLRLLGFSIVTSLIPYILLLSGQGHGWGYRYLHVHLGSFALLAVFGWYQLRSRLDPAVWPRWRRALIGLAVFSVMVGLPLRAYQVDTFLTPFVRSLDFLANRQEEVILVDRYRIWYGTDLVRNDPLLRNSPKILDPYSLSEEDLSRICSEYSVLYVDDELLGPFGMRRPNQMYLEAWLEEKGDVRTRLARAGCISSGENEPENATPERSG